MRVTVKTGLLLVLVGLLLVALFIVSKQRQEAASTLGHRVRYMQQVVTRDPSRVIHYNYPLYVRARVNREPIDISVQMPPRKEMDDHIVVVTGLANSKIKAGLGMLASVHAHMAVKKIIVYNLGLHPRYVQQIRQMCNVEVRKFDFTRYPKHVSKVENRSWRVYALREVLLEFGAFFYASPMVRFRAPINFIIPYIQRSLGIMMKRDELLLTANVTHPGLFQFLGSSPKAFSLSYPGSLIASEHIWLAVNSSETEAAIWQPLMRCAADWHCIGPHGSSWEFVEPKGTVHTHRYDMSALSLLLYRNYNRTWWGDSETNAMLKRVADVNTRQENDYLWAHYCNPPKQEVDCSNNNKKC